MCYHVLRVCSTGEVASTHTAGWSWSTQGINVIEELLTPRERFLVYQYDIAYQEIYRSPAISNQSLVYFLGDRFEFSKTWSAHSGRIPTYRKNSAKYLHRSSMQVYTGQDKLCSLGWPVNSKLARNMLTSPMPSIDPDRSDFLAGNSMHVANCSIVMLVALSCFGYHSCGPVCKWCFTSLSDADQNTWLAYLGRLFGWLLHFEICEVFCGQIKVTKLFSDKVVNCKLRFIPATVHMTSRCKHYTSWVAPKFLLLLSSLTHYLKPSQSCAPCCSLRFTRLLRYGWEGAWLWSRVPSCKTNDACLSWATGATQSSSMGSPPPPGHYAPTSTDNDVWEGCDCHRSCSCCQTWGCAYQPSPCCFCEYRHGSLEPLSTASSSTSSSSTSSIDLRFRIKFNWLLTSGN